MDDLHSHFFFSSRRRHTRWPRDWSSDVCSSDLYQHLERMPFSSTPDLYHCEGGLCALMQQEELRHLVAHHYGAVASTYEAPLEQQRARLLQFCWQLQCLKGNNTLVLEAPQATQLHSALPHKAYGTVSALLKALYLHTLENQRLMMLEQHFLYEHCQDQ